MVFSTNNLKVILFISIFHHVINRDECHQILGFHGVRFMRQPWVTNMEATELGKVCQVRFIEQLQQPQC